MFMEEPRRSQRNAVLQRQAKTGLQAPGSCLPPPLFSQAARQSSVPLQFGGFDDKTLYSGQIYGIYNNSSGDFDASDCVYVGKTVGADVGTRWLQHIDKDAGKPWYKMKLVDGDSEAYVVRQIWGFKNITRFDVAVAEQYYIQKAINEWDATLLNKINALTKSKFDAYKDKDVFTTKSEYGTWEPDA